ncbi:MULTISPECIES: phosphoenolpyruvate--protein phosphotransferase [Alteromonadaceae]|jgi:phosphotransferase system enzyme I (PtsP)|uniref:phosphoenolpyruvate--protein phosphotransferase n=1 Tax=Brumicola blandensis TaxID=3075611 RepID=A0AAW8QZC9_9ALTE|nr:MULTISPECIES: phosphoenolpyruvate--protein phosphotransferase [unclassified Alteromonas]MDT0582431.1 phosphoenolpyruvate--protein phosphotransferase [Alteromonas sp. W409]MDT0628653.1 phosphoenolpyruvate--protein phosphotransferase [Alteromonas sp. W364]
MLTTLKRIVQEVNQIPGLEPALARLATLVKETMKVDSCAIYLADYKNQVHVLKATDGLERSAVNKVKIGFSEGLIGLVGQREEPLNIENAPLHPRFKHFPEVNEDSLFAFIGTPIIHQRKVLGVISMQQKSIRRFSEDEEAFLVTLATQIGLEIANAEMLGVLDVSIDNSANDQKSINGVPGSPGLAIGNAVVLNMKHELSQLVLRKTSDQAGQVEAYRKAVEITRGQVASLSDNLGSTLPEDVKAIFQLYHQLLDANSLGREVEQKIRENWDAASSLKLVVEAYATKFASMEDPYMQERAVDIVDLSNRILHNIMDANSSPLKDPAKMPESAILVAKEVSAPMLAEFPAKQLKAIVSIQGSNNSHAAILARAMGVPAVMGLGQVPLNFLNHKELFVDGYSGQVVVSPEALAREEFLQLIAEEETLSQKIASQAEAPSTTQDGCDMTLLVNAGLSADLEMDNNKEGAGVGLYRTEIPFMLRERFPSEQEQYELYRAMLNAHPEKEMTMRTLDVGGDKPLSYFPINEENPFLGWRGIRLTLDHPDIFLVQVRAMLRASIGLHNLHILLPMISTLNEIDDAKRLIKQAFHEVKEEAVQANQELFKPAIGVMLEVPAVIFQLEQIAEKVDFFSVGTNDLTQYLLAVDRNNSRVSSLYSSYHPSVLLALNHIMKSAEVSGTPITVCGELAGEPTGALILMAMGYRKLSMNAHSLRKINWVIRNVSVAELENLLADILGCCGPENVKEIVDEYLESKGLGGLVRAGS